MHAGEAISILAERHYDGLLSYVQNRVRSRTVAADIVQESWLRVIAAVHAGQVANPRNYLFRTAHNVLMDHFRREKTRGTWISSAEAPIDVVCDAPSPERAIIARDELRRLLAIVAEMPARRQQVFVLRAFEQMDQADIAASLRITRGAVEKHMRLALAHCLTRFVAE